MLTLRSFCASFTCSYDPRTLYVPPEWFKQAKVSPGQQQVGGNGSRNVGKPAPLISGWQLCLPLLQHSTTPAPQPFFLLRLPPLPCLPCGVLQWWEFKAAHYDCVLLFKMGKFYELFEMDAHVAVEILGLSYMKVSWLGMCVGLCS
jgi:hypothetical protein